MRVHFMRVQKLSAPLIWSGFKKKFEYVPMSGLADIANARHVMKHPPSESRMPLYSRNEGWKCWASAPGKNCSPRHGMPNN
jgi:hypothetical protein